MKRIFFEVPHASTAYIAKNLIPELRKVGLDVICVVREHEEMVRYLLEHFGIFCEELKSIKKGIFNKALRLPINEMLLLELISKYKPDILVGRNSPYFSHVSKITKRPFISILDSDIKSIIYWLTIPFADTVITPNFFNLDLGKKQVRVISYKELAYLHPNRFCPDESIYTDLGISKGEKYMVIRLGSFDAAHDISTSGFTPKDVRKIVDAFKDKMNVFISPKDYLKDDLKKFALEVPIEKMHDVLYYAELLITDTQTSTTEAACLGTPAIRSNKWVGPNDMSNFIELEQKYGLIYNIREGRKAIEKAVELMQKPNLKQEWQKKREKLLKDKIDLTSFLIWFIENYPESHRIMKGNPEYQERFK